MARTPSSPHSRRMARAARDRLEGFALRMRHAPTPSEEALWQRLKGGQLGVAFRRQVVLGEPGGKFFVADFCAPSVRLVVEVDGGYHTERTRSDARRDRTLQRLGYRVVRVSAELVERDIEVAVSVVREALTA
jgi:very-short-patch-repair endonuclease